MKFYTNNFIEYIYKEIYNYCWLLLITGLNLKSKSLTTYRVTLYNNNGIEVHVHLHTMTYSPVLWTTISNHFLIKICTEG